MPETRSQLGREERKLRDLLMDMSKAAARALSDALRCYRNQDLALAREIIANDARINGMQREVEQECLVTIARQQPVASDLRNLVSDTYIAIELERIADYAAAIARIVSMMDRGPDGASLDSIDRLGEKCLGMLDRIMEAYNDCDVGKARDVAAEDDEVDRAHRQISDGIFSRMRSSPDDSARCMHTLWIVHAIERVGDRVTNIAERIVFLATGESTDLNC